MRRSRARMRKLRRSRRPVRLSISEAANLDSGAITPAARMPPSSSQTPRQMQVSPPRIWIRAEISTPGSCTRRNSSKMARSWGMASAYAAAAAHSGASGPNPRLRAAPVIRIRSRPGSQFHSTTSAEARASNTAVASQNCWPCRMPRLSQRAHLRRRSGNVGPDLGRHQPEQEMISPFAVNFQISRGAALMGESGPK